MTRFNKSSIVTWLTLFSVLLSFCGSTAFMTGANAQSKQKSQKFEKAKFPMLSGYATDLTEMARRGEIDSKDSHEADVSRSIQILSRDSKNNPVLTSESIADSKAVADALAMRIADGNVPRGLIGKRIFSLNLDSLFHGIEVA